MKKMVRFLSITLLILSFLGCKKENKKTGTPVAQVGENTLYREDIEKLIPENISYEDSINFAQDIIKQWVKEQILLQTAETELKDDMEEIEKKTEEFRKSLLLHEVRQKYLKEHLDTTVTEEESQEYYEAHKNECLLQQDLIKGIFLKIPKSMNLKNVTEQLKNDELVKKAELFEKIKKQGGTTDDFSGQWHYYDEYSPYFPPNTDLSGNILTSSDEKFYYVLMITSFLGKGEPKPYEMCISNIKSIILNKRRSSLLEEMETKLYQEAEKNGTIKIY